MPTVIRRTREITTENRREIFHAIGWQVRSNIWNPPTDIYENETALLVRVEVAGMREEDFDISIQNTNLFITGTRHDLPERRAYHQMEIQTGKFAIAVDLPNTINIENAQAEYKDGFLTITLPKEKSK